MDAPNPAQPVNKAVRGAAGMFRKLPRWAWIGLIGGTAILAIYFRHRSNAGALAAADATNSSDPTATSGQGTTNTGPVDTGQDAYTYDLGTGASSFQEGGIYGYNSPSQVTGTLPPAVGVINIGPPAVTVQLPPSPDKALPKPLQPHPDPGAGGRPTGGGPPHRPDPGKAHKPPNNNKPPHHGPIPEVHPHPHPPTHHPHPHPHPRAGAQH